MRNGMIDNMQCADAHDQLQNDLMVEMWTNWNVNNMEDSEESDSDSGYDSRRTRKISTSYYLV